MEAKDHEETLSSTTAAAAAAASMCALSKVRRRRRPARMRRQEEEEEGKGEIAGVEIPGEKRDSTKFRRKTEKFRARSSSKWTQTYRSGEISFLITCGLNWRIPPSTLGVDSLFSRLPPLKVKSPPPPPPLSFVLQSTLPQPASFSAAAFSPSPARGWKKREGGGFWLGAGGGGAPIGK